MAASTTFLFNLFCATVICFLPFKQPQDPLYSQRTLTKRHHLLLDPTNQYPIVHTNYGLVQGYKMASITKKVIYAFEGIPYGETTEGENRFRLAKPKAPWSGIKAAQKRPPYCTQIHFFRLTRLEGVEDCLFVNVYSSLLPPQDKSKFKKLPVIVFIHGGGFFFSTGSEYGPAYLLEQDVVFVTFNYRLGLFGFLSVDDKSVMPDNLGFKDQALALKWIYENIEYFGGDKSRITLMGLSSGATAVHLHYFSNLTRNYFTSGISLSGTAFTPGTTMTKKQVHILTQRLAWLTNCPNPVKNTNIYKNTGVSASAKFINCLRKISANELAGLNMDMFDGRLVRFGVVVEDEKDHGAFLSGFPDDIYINGRIAKKPWIGTRVRDEGQCAPIGLQAMGFEFILSLRSSLISQRIIRQLKESFPTVLDFKYVEKEKQRVIINKIMDFYLGGPPPYRLKKSTTFGDIVTDRSFLEPLNKALRYHSQFAPTFSYMYDYKAKNSMLALFGLPITERHKYDVCHADDIATILNMTFYLDNYSTTDKDYAIIKLLANLFANFAATGKPTYTDTNGHELDLWKPISDPHQLQFLKIDNEVKMIPEPEHEKRRVAFWETLGLEDAKPWKFISNII